MAGKQPKNKTSGARPAKVVIGAGKYKRTPVPVADAEGLRPTGSRVRETLFNWATFLLGSLEGRQCLDLFAGSGVLSFEAASRGAAHVDTIEADRRVCAAISALKAKLGAHEVTVHLGDAFDIGARLASKGNRYDLIFVDPPFALGLTDKALVLCRQLVAPDGFVYVESPDGVDLSPDGPFAKDWECVREAKAGHVTFQMLRAI